MLRALSNEALAASSVRLLGLLVAGLAFAIAGLTPTTEITTLGAAYLVAIAALAGLALRPGARAAAWVGSLVDVASVAAFGWLAPHAALPLWGLLLLPVAVAAVVEWRPAVLAGVLGLAAFGVDASRAASSAPMALGSAALLAAGMVGIIAASGAREARQRRTLRQLLAEQAQAEVREALRRERVLRAAASALAAASEATTARQAILEAAREGAGATAALIGTTTGELLAGDAALLARPRVSAEHVGRSFRRDTALAFQLGEHGVLLAWREAPPLDAEARAWLEELGTLAAPALARATAHAALARREQRLGRLLEELPAPVAAWEGSALVLANAGYRALGLPDTPPASAGSQGEEEVRAGDPPRTFLVATRTLEGGELLRLYRDVTREREALRAKDELISVVGHELRTPLTSIYGYSQMMAKHLGVVQQQIGQLNALIRDFMDASRLESGELPLQRTTVSVADLAQTAAERFRGGHASRDLRLELDENLPAVEGDPARLGQVLDNLLGNAAKYSPEDRPVSLSARSEGGEVLLRVKDEGVGIAPEHLPHVFDRFYRVPAESTEHTEGFGLGLAIVRDLVQAHGGRVWAESGGAGQGSTFVVALPAASASSDVPEGAEAGVREALRPGGRR